MPDNRKRNITLTIRLTPGEKDTIVRKAKQADMTLTDFVVAAVLSTQIYVAEDMKLMITGISASAVVSVLCLVLLRLAM